MEDWQLCRELLRFLRSIDENGTALREALDQTRILNIDIDLTSANGDDTIS